MGQVCQITTTTIQLTALKSSKSTVAKATKVTKLTKVTKVMKVKVMPKKGIVKGIVGSKIALKPKKNVPRKLDAFQKVDKKVGMYIVYRVYSI